MGRFVSFSEWQEIVKENLTDEDMAFECAECDGEGEAFTECHCCGQDTYEKCEKCRGYGWLTYSYTGRMTHPELTRKAYIKAVTDDIKKLCAFSGWDFLEMAGIFFNEQRGSERNG